MKQKGKIFVLGAITMLTAVAFATSTFAWFAYIPTLEFGTGSGKINVGAGSETSYYESGSGDSIDDPYIISNRNHLYNLAWLQYMGMYNKPNIQQKYFKLKNDIDMSGITLPPIGTDEYPFLGHFDGNNKVVSNLVVSNDDPLQTNSDFGMTKPTSTNLQSTEQPEIVGFFGVVGQSPVIDDLTYTSSIVSVTDVTLNNITVRSKTDNTLIGLAVGYVDGTLSGVKIDGEATIDVDGQSTTASINSITNNISDYGLVGYSTKTSRSGSYSQDISAYYDSEDNEGQGANWGGSIAIDDLFDRLLDIKNTYTIANTSFATERTNYYKNGSTFVRSENTNTSSTTIYEYNENKNSGTYNNKLGAFQMGDTRTDIHYLSGGHYTKNENLVKHTGGRPITDGTNYLSVFLFNNSSVLFTNRTSEDDCTFWNMPINGSGKIYVNDVRNEISGYSCYLSITNGILDHTDSSSSATTWTVTSSNGILSIVSGNYHLIYDNEWIVRDFTKTSDTYYTIRDNNSTPHYFAPGYSTTYMYYLRPTTDASEQITWYYDTTNKAYYYIRDGASRYLMLRSDYTSAIGNNNIDSGRILKLSTGTSTGTGYLQARPSNQYYYVKFNGSLNDNGWVTSTGTSGRVTFIIESHTTTYNNVDNVLDRTSDYYGPDSTSISEYMDYSEQDVTYFPLNVKDDYTPADNNTGYMIGGSSYTSNSTNYGAGTVRISNFYSLSTNITNFNRQTYKLSSVRTYNGSGNTTINDNSNAYQKYAASKEKVENMLKKHSSDNKVYGLHFMGDSISTSKLVTAKYAQINTSVYSNYQLPASSIDFNLKERGFVNFFAGTYGNLSGEDTTIIDSFFSLHLIQRNSNNAITNIYEIDQILSDGNQDHAYIYKLSNGKYTIPYSYNIYNQKVKYVVDTKTPLSSVYPNEEFTMVDSYPNTYSVAFDTSWIKVHNNFDQHVMYYFEIPINCGEFCLGSVENSHFGAYLVYLDIGAFARDDDAVHAYCVTTNVNSLAYPDGVDFAAGGASGVTGGETFCILLPTDITGSVSFAVTSTNIEISDSSALSTYSYKGSRFSDSPHQDAFTVSGDSPGALVAPPAGGERLIHIQIDAVDGSRWDIDILDILRENGTIQSTSYPMIKQDGVNKTVNDIPEVLSDVLDTKIRTLTKIVSLTRNTGTTQFVSTATYDESTRKVVNISISNEDLANTSIEVGNIATGYTISINGTPVSNGTIYPN